jgi:Flp pilus assembly protein TadG
MPRRIVLGSRRSDPKGQGLAEFALVLPVFALAVFGLLDVGKLVYTNAALSQAAREGARLAATEAAWVGSTSPGCGSGNPYAPVCPANVSELMTHVTTAVNRMTVGLGPVTAVHLSCNAGTGSDAAPSGAWTDDPGGGGNGCQNGSGDPLGAAGELVSVRVEYTYQPITPIISSIVGALPLSGSATMVVH